MSVEGAPLSCLVLIDGRERHRSRGCGEPEKNVEQRREWRVRRGESEAGDEEEEEEGGRLNESARVEFSPLVSSRALARSFRSVRSPLSSSVLILLVYFAFPVLSPFSPSLTSLLALRSLCPGGESPPHNFRQSIIQDVRNVVRRSQDRRGLGTRLGSCCRDETRTITLDFSTMGNA